MQANELRKGNYFNIIDRTKELHLPIDFTQEVLSIGLFKVEFVNAGKNPALQEKLFKVNIFDMSPIRLTEDWILKLGFEVDRMSKWGGWLSPRFDLGGQIRIRDYIDYFKMQTAKIKYVHQLQNLYFALTGKELKLIS